MGPYNCKVEEVFKNDVDISVVGEVDKNLGVPAPARLFLQPSSPLGSYLPLPPAQMELNMGNTQALYGKKHRFMVHSVHIKANMGNSLRYQQLNH